VGRFYLYYSLLTFFSKNISLKIWQIKKCCTFAEHLLYFVGGINKDIMKDTKEHILKTVFLLFLQKNYKAVTLKDIISVTGLSNVAFY
jgi:hypothetical protein